MTQNWLLFCMAFLSSLLLPVVIKPMLYKLKVMDIPNERSSHSRPVVRGMGLAPLISVVLTFGIATMIVEGAATYFIILLGVALAAGMIGWIEDFKGLAIAVRAGCQLIVGVLLTIALVYVNEISLTWFLLIPVFITAYINFANFMDGINGISGLHGAVTGIAYSYLGYVYEIDWLVPAGIILAAAFTAFLPWNLWGKVFLGDVGSYTLGGTVITLAIFAYFGGVSIPVSLAPLWIYLADTVFTFFRRLLRGDKWYESHREHVYQQLTDVGLSHLKVAFVVAFLSLLTSTAAFLLEGFIWVRALIMLILGVLYILLPKILGNIRVFSSDTK